VPCSSLSAISSVQPAAQLCQCAACRAAVPVCCSSATAVRSQRVGAVLCAPVLRQCAPAVLWQRAPGCAVCSSTVPVCCSSAVAACCSAVCSSTVRQRAPPVLCCGAGVRSPVPGTILTPSQRSPPLPPRGPHSPPYHPPQPSALSPQPSALSPQPPALSPQPSAGRISQRNISRWESTIVLLIVLVPPGSQYWAPGVRRWNSSA
jgi:hypothetical protein